MKRFSREKSSNHGQIHSVSHFIFYITSLVKHYAKDLLMSFLKSGHDFAEPESNDCEVETAVALYHIIRVAVKN